MPAPSKDGRNPVKTRDQAATSKKNVALSKASLEADWQRKLKKDGPRIDRKIDDMNKLAKKIGEAMKKQEETKKMLEDLGDMVLGTLKELKTWTEVPVKGELPKPPVNTAGLSVLLPVLIGIAAWWKLVKKAK
jgi:hypothetical protein